MNPPRAVIADDEEVLLQGLKRMLGRLWTELEICGEAQTGQEALALIDKTNPDIAFLDIKMPGLSGIQVARKISSPCRIVFITAFDHYAVKAFENEAVDYLLKPVTESRLEKTVARLKSRLPSEPDAFGLVDKMEKIIRALENPADLERLKLIKVKTGSELRFIPVSEVLFFKSEDKYTVVQTAEKEFLIKTPIKDLEKALDPDRFQRVHRSSIVNIEKIKLIRRTFTNQMVITFRQTDRTIPVARSREHLFNQT